MSLIEVDGVVDDQGKLKVDLPSDIMPGKVHLILIQEQILTSLEDILNAADLPSIKNAIWDALLASSHDVLAMMSRDIRAEHAAGLTEDFDPDTYIPHVSED